MFTVCGSSRSREKGEYQNKLGPLRSFIFCANGLLPCAADEIKSPTGSMKPSTREAALCHIFHVRRYLSYVVLRAARFKGLIQSTTPSLRKLASLTGFLCVHFLCETDEKNYPPLPFHKRNRSQSPKRWHSEKKSFEPNFRVVSHLSNLNPSRRSRAPLRRDSLPGSLENLHLPLGLSSGCVSLFPLG